MKHEGCLNMNGQCQECQSDCSTWATLCRNCVTHRAQLIGEGDTDAEYVRLLRQRDTAGIIRPVAVT